jgi:hypothetical protein
MLHHIIDLSGTDWSTEATAEQVAHMNRLRVEEGLPQVEPIDTLPQSFPTDMDPDFVEGALAAGEQVYLVNLAEPGAALAVYHAGAADNDPGPFGSLPAGRTVHLVETGGATTWTARTVAEVADLRDCIEWLRLALRTAGLNEPARYEHTSMPDWPTHVTTYISDAVDRGEQVWTVALVESQAAIQLAQQAGLPGIAQFDGKLLVTPGMDPDAIRAAFAVAHDVISAARPGAGKTEDPADIRALFAAPHLKKGPTGEARSFNDFFRDVVIAGRDDVIHLLRDDEQNLRFDRLVWTDRASSVQEGNFSTLRGDLSRRHQNGGPDIAHMYVLTTDAELVKVAWDVQAASPHLDGSAARRLTITTPGGSQITGTYRITA